VHWFYDPAFSNTSTSIGDSEQKHFRALRIQKGEGIVVTNGLGESFECEVLELTPPSLLVTKAREHSRSPLSFHLIQALAKNDRDELAMQTAIELGAIEITPWSASRCIIRWDGKLERNQLRWQQISTEAMKQSQQAWLPVINPLSSTKQLICGQLGIVLDPRAEIGLKDLDLSIEHISIAVGPEGGITDSEMAVLESKGFIRVRLGQSVLRSSSAGPAAIAAISALGANWDKA
jgi:16S rRNA (uracil1498-N3)-methyltransferase